MKVQIRKDKDGLYVARTLSGGEVKSVAAAKSRDRAVLTRIYKAAGHEIVTRWS